MQPPGTVLPDPEVLWDRVLSRKEFKPAPTGSNLVRILSFFAFPTQFQLEARLSYSESSSLLCSVVSRQCRRHWHGEPYNHRDGLCVTMTVVCCDDGDPAVRLLRLHRDPRLLPERYRKGAQLVDVMTPTPTHWQSSQVPKLARAFTSARWLQNVAGPWRGWRWCGEALGQRPLVIPQPGAVVRSAPPGPFNSAFPPPPPVGLVLLCRAHWDCAFRIPRPHLWRPNRIGPRRLTQSQRCTYFSQYLTFFTPWHASLHLGTGTTKLCRTRCERSRGAS